MALRCDICCLMLCCVDLRCVDLRCVALKCNVVVVCFGCGVVSWL